MMEQEWAAVLARYGQQVVLTRGQGEPAQVRAFLQPVMERQAQYVPTPLGCRNGERWIYLGPPQEEVTVGETAVTWGEREFEVDSARQVWAGDGPSHWWALLRPAEEVQA